MHEIATLSVTITRQFVRVIRKRKNDFRVQHEIPDSKLVFHSADDLPGADGTRIEL
jgi:hypothetical protein